MLEKCKTSLSRPKKIFMIFNSQHKYILDIYMFLNCFHTLFHARPKKRGKETTPRWKVFFRDHFVFFGKCRTHVPSARSNSLHFLSEKPSLTRDFSRGITEKNTEFTKDHRTDARPVTTAIYLLQCLIIKYFSTWVNIRK